MNKHREFLEVWKRRFEPPECELDEVPLNALTWALEQADEAERLREVNRQWAERSIADAQEIDRLKRLNESLAERVAAQSELLTKRADKDAVCKCGHMAQNHPALHGCCARNSEGRICPCEMFRESDY